jgi:hypothetical protein
MKNALMTCDFSSRQVNHWYNAEKRQPYRMADYRFRSRERHRGKFFEGGIVLAN